MLTAPLSRLQQTILRVAFQHRQAYGTPTPELGAGALIDASSQELLAACYGAPTESLRREVERPGHPKFGHLLKGEDLPDGARPALSRALTRLEQRGLVNVYSGQFSKWTGIVLTDDGLHVAAALPDVPGWPLPLKEPWGAAESAAWDAKYAADEANRLDDVLAVVTKFPGLDLSRLRSKLRDPYRANDALRQLVAAHRVTKIKTRDGIRYYPGNVTIEDVSTGGGNDRG